MKLIEELYRKYSREDFLVSPYSIHLALAMAKDGAMGETLREMEDLLGDDPEFLEVETLKVANAIWLMVGIESSWRTLIKDKYHGEAYDVLGKFGIIGMINDWVNEKTNGKIKKIIDRLQPDDKVILTNAIHFKDDWAKQFEKNRTKMEPFYGKNILTNVEMMNMTSWKHIYYEGANVRAVELPYMNRDITMTIILPKVKEDLVSTDSLMEVIAGRFYKRDVKLSMPKFTARKTYSLNDVLIPKIPLAFSDAADFRRMVGNPKDLVKIGDVIHKTFIQVDEEGTEAAAVTGVTMKALGMTMPPEPIIFRVDHPYVYYIEHRPSKTMLFLGGVVDPEGSASH